MRLRALLLGWALAIGAVAAQNDAIREDMRRLEGKWAQVSVEADGKKLEDHAVAPKVVVLIKGNQWLETPAAAKPTVSDTSTFQIRPGKSPKEIDLTMRLGDKDKHSTFPGIYRLDEDTLTTAVPFPFEGDFSQIDKRPGTFLTKPGDGFVVIVYKRIER